MLWRSKACKSYIIIEMFVLVSCYFAELRIRLLNNYFMTMHTHFLFSMVQLSHKFITLATKHRPKANNIVTAD